MNLRNYNVYFHTHTISGIIISLILYVIFFVWLALSVALIARNNIYKTNRDCLEPCEKR